MFYSVGQENLRLRESRSTQKFRHPELIEGSASGDILHPGNVRIKVPFEGKISQKGAD
jgi:hypothetical protein